MTYTYVASTNTVRQKSELAEPLQYRAWLACRENDKYLVCTNEQAAEIKEYDNHLASLKEIACDESCKEVWKDGQEVIDGKDFETRLFYHAPDDKELRAYLIKAESEDELWADALGFLVNNPSLNYPSQIKELKKKYTISKKK